MSDRTVKTIFSSVGGYFWKIIRSEGYTICNSVNVWKYTMRVHGLDILMDWVKNQIIKIASWLRFQKLVVYTSLKNNTNHQTRKQMYRKCGEEKRKK